MSLNFLIAVPKKKNKVSFEIDKKFSSFSCINTLGGNNCDVFDVCGPEILLFNRLRASGLKAISAEVFKKQPPIYELRV